MPTPIASTSPHYAGQLAGNAGYGAAPLSPGGPQVWALLARYRCRHSQAGAFGHAAAGHRHIAAVLLVDSDCRNAAVEVAGA